MRKLLVVSSVLAVVGLAGYVSEAARRAADDPPADSTQVKPEPAAGDQADAQPRAFRSANEIERHFDRLKIQALADYLASGDRADAEAGYMLLFNVVIEHDLFTEHEKIADRYLQDRTDGTVTPLARTIKAMALAARAEFAQASRAYGEMLAEINPQNARFAWSFGASLARQALAAGDARSARQILSDIAKRFPDEQGLQQETTAQLKKIDLIGKPAPGFAVPDLDDKTVSLVDYRGKVVLLDFWATWCAPCVAELPNIRAVYDEYHSRGFDVVSVSLDENADAVREFLNEHDLPWRQVLNRGDKEHDIVGRYGVDRIPATFLLDAEGKIQRVDLRGDGLGRAVAELVGKKTSARKGAVSR